jgi:hypothetical protein
MKEDYKARRAARHVTDKANKLRKRVQSGNFRTMGEWAATQHIDLRTAVHELGHGAMAIPESEWHIAFGMYADCPACQGHTPVESPLALAAHHRDTTRWWLKQEHIYELTDIERLYRSLSGGAAEFVCFDGLLRSTTRTTPTGSPTAWPMTSANCATWYLRIHARA